MHIGFFFNKKDVILVPNDHTHSRAKTDYAEYKKDRTVTKSLFTFTSDCIRM